MAFARAITNMRRWTGVLGRAAADGLMPPRCVFCGTHTCDEERSICAGCSSDLPWLRHGCPRCALPLATALPVGLVCATCQLQPALLTAVVAPLEYAFPIDVAIKAMKFHRRLYYMPAFGDLLQSVTGALPQTIDAILPVPLHRWRQWSRGFNQALELAKPVQKALEVPLLCNVRRRVPTPYQSELNAAERRKNLSAAFEVDGELRAKHVLIVDDVITTGETCRHLARLLLAHGADEVSAIALARA